MCKEYHKIQKSLPSRRQSMINLIKNNKKISWLPNSIAKQLTSEQKLQLYEQFADYLINKGGIGVIRSRAKSNSDNNNNNVETKTNDDFDLLNSNGDADGDCVKIMLGVNATKLSQYFGEKGIKFKRIYFNCPHWLGMTSESGKIADKIVKPFFMSAKEYQNVGDKIYLSIPYPKHVNRNMWHTDIRGTHVQYIEGYGYGLYDASKAAHYKCVKKRAFGAKKYPGYKHCCTKHNKSAKISCEMRQYIFVKWKPNEEINYTPNDDLLLKKRRKTVKTKQIKTFHVLPHYNTDNDSSGSDSELRVNNISETRYKYKYSDGKRAPSTPEYSIPDRLLIYPPCEHDHNDNDN